MIWRIRDRATFLALRSDGVRAWQGPVGVTFLPPRSPAEGLQPPRVAFAIGRKVGHAVERNRLRRRMRAILAGLDAELLPPGAYLVTAQAAAVALSHQELREHVERALTRITQRVDGDLRRQVAR